jgi:hypothetical protein
MAGRERVPARTGWASVKYTVPVVWPVLASAANSFTVPRLVPVFETITAPLTTLPRAAS